MNFYNENNPFAADWLENLIKEGLIPDGIVDRRSINDLAAEDVAGFTQVHLFAGIGGWSLALRIAGWPDDRRIGSGSCPCQPYSSAGKHRGNKDKRNLWPEMFRIVRESEIDVWFGEQVASAIGHGWLDGISHNLESEGYAVGASVLGAFSVGAPHKRSRLYWVAKSCRSECGRGSQSRGEHGGALHVADGRIDDRMGNSASKRRDATSNIVHRTERDRKPVGVPGIDRPLEHSAGNGRNERWSESGGGSVASGRSVGRMVDATCGGALSTKQPGFVPSIEPTSYWSDFRLTKCTDGKSRRVGCGVQPLVAGIPIGMGSGVPEISKLVKSARNNRVGRLTGYGNAITVQTAAMFVRAFMETEQ